MVLRSCHSSKLIPHSYLVVGLEDYSKKRLRKAKNTILNGKNRLKIFLKIVNIKHMMPTRFFMDLTKISIKLVEEKVEYWIKFHSNSNGNLAEYCTKTQLIEETKVLADFLKNILLDHFLSGKQKWFFKKLRF